MKLHEKHCTANAKRDCRMCNDVVKGYIPHVIRDFQLRYEFNTKMRADQLETLEVVWEDGEITLDEIKGKVGACPNCTLTIIRGTGLLPYHDFKFDYEKEVTAWWTERNAEKEIHW